MDNSQFYDVPEVPASWNFELVGHAEKTLGVESLMLGSLTENFRSLKPTYF